MDLEIESQAVNANGSIDGLDATGTISTSQSPSAADAEKVNRILAASRENDLDFLAALATSPGGLLEDEIRRTACMCPHLPKTHTRTCRICDS